MEETTIWDLGKDFFSNGVLVFLIYSAVILIIAALISSGLKTIFEKNAKTRRLPFVYLHKIITFLLYTLAIFSILSQVKMLQNLGMTLLGATSIVTVIVGLAAQATFGNFISGFFLSIYQPFTVGDTVSLPEKGLFGTVEAITFRHTVLRSIENTKYVIPNNVMDSAVVENRAFGQPYFKRRISVSVGYDSDTALVRRLITDTVLASEEYVDIRTEEEKRNGADPVTIRLEDFGASGLEFIFFMVSRTLGDSYTGASKVRLKLLEEFRAHNITIPYQTLDVYVKKDTE